MVLQVPQEVTHEYRPSSKPGHQWLWLLSLHPASKEAIILLIEKLRSQNANSFVDNKMIVKT